MASPESRMAAGEYEATRAMVIGVGQVLASLDLESLDRLIETADRAQSVGPILDPTLYRAAAANLSDELTLFRAVRAVRAKLEELHRGLRGARMPDASPSAR